MHTLHKISVPVIAVTLAFTLASCTGAPAEEKSASGSSSSAELKLETSEEIQTKLSLIEVLLKSQEEAAAKGFTEDQGAVASFFAYDPETKREVYLEDYPGYDGQPMPPIWSESTGQIPTFYYLISTVGSGAISDYSYSADNNEIKFTVSGGDLMSNPGMKQTIRFYINDNGVIQKIEQNGNTQEMVYSVTDQAKEYFATAINQEEYSQKEQEYYESQDPSLMFPE